MEDRFHSRLCVSLGKLFLIYNTHLQRRNVGRIEELLAILQKVLVLLTIVVAHTRDRRTDKIPFRRIMDPDRLIPLAEDLHANFLTRKLKLDIQQTLLTDKIFLFDPNRRNNESD